MSINQDEACGQVTHCANKQMIIYFDVQKSKDVTEDFRF